MFGKQGNVTTVEFVIVLLILTFFTFYPFAIYSTYQKKDILENIKDRGLNIVANIGKPNETTISSLIKEFEFYNLKPRNGQKIVITFYSIEKESIDMDSSEKVVYEILNNGGTLIGKTPISDTMPITIKNKDMIRMTIEYPGDNFLNSILGLIGKRIANDNTTGALYAYKVTGFIMSEYEPE